MKIMQKIIANIKKLLTFAHFFGNSNISKNILALATICHRLPIPAESPNVSPARRRRSLAADTKAAV